MIFLYHMVTQSDECYFSMTGTQCFDVGGGLKVYVIVFPLQRCYKNAMASLILGNSIFVQHLGQVDMEENITASDHWPFVTGIMSATNQTVNMRDSCIETT